MHSYICSTNSLASIQPSPDETNSTLPPPILVYFPIMSLSTFPTNSFQLSPSIFSTYSSGVCKLRTFAWFASASLFRSDWDAQYMCVSPRGGIMTIRLVQSSRSCLKTMQERVAQTGRKQTGVVLTMQESASEMRQSPWLGRNPEGQSRTQIVEYRECCWSQMTQGLSLSRPGWQVLQYLQHSRHWSRRGEKEQEGGHERRVGWLELWVSCRWCWGGVVLVFFSAMAKERITQMERAKRRMPRTQRLRRLKDARGAGGREGRGRGSGRSSSSTLSQFIKYFISSSLINPYWQSHSKMRRSGPRRVCGSWGRSWSRCRPRCRWP